MRRKDDLGPALELMRELWAVAHGLELTSRRMARELGVTGPQRVVLLLLQRFPGSGPSQLAEWLHLDRSTITGIVDRLVREGLVRRMPDPLDRRRARLQLTSRARRITRKRAGTVEAAVTRWLRELAQVEIRTTIRALRALAGELL